MKKRLIILTLWCCIIFCFTGCKTKYNSEVQSTTVSEEIASVEETKYDAEAQSTTVSEEIASVEAAYQDILSRDTSNYTQGDMNAECYEEYELWNNELNNLWEQIKSSLDEGAYSTILDEQHAWLERKKFHVRACGSEAFGGSMQPMLESIGAAEMTRVRCYQLAKILADAKSEPFSMGEIEALVDNVDPSYDDVMQGFSGSYDMTSYDDSTGSLMISHESDEWEAIITYNGERQQVELWGYTSERIIWKNSEDDFFEVGLSMENDLVFTHRDDLGEYVDAY